MSNVATSLLDFILDLLSDPETAADFEEDAQGALEDAGLGDLCAADVDAILPMLADFAPVGIGGGGGSRRNSDDDDDETSNAGRPDREHRPDRDSDDRDSDDDDNGYKPDHGHKPDHDDDHDGYLAIEHIKHIQNHYTYSPTTTIDASHSVWGDSYKIWAEDDAVVAVNGAIAAGDDVKDSDVDNSVRDSYNEIDVEGDGNAVGRDNDVENEDSFNDNSAHGIGNATNGSDIEDSFDPTITNSGNTQTGTGNVAGEGNDVETENSGNEVEVEGDGNVAIGEDNEVGDETDDVVDVNVENSGNEVEGDGNNFGEENDSENDNSVDFTLEESFNEIDNSTAIEESFNDNAFAAGEAIANTGDPNVEIDD